MGQAEGEKKITKITTEQNVSQKERFDALMGNPCQETCDAYLKIVAHRAARGFQKESREQFMEMIRCCVKNDNEFLRSAMVNMQVYFMGRDSENQMVNVIKCVLRRGFFGKTEYIGIYLKKCRAPQYVKRQAIRRMAVKPFKFIGRVLPNIVSKVKTAVAKVTGVFSRQHQYRRYGYTRNTLEAWEAMMVADSKLNASKDKSVVDWAHKNGFLYARVAQYGLTEGNLDRYISDRDYILLNPINNSYKKWIEDIPSLTYCVPKAGHRLPKLYYHVLRRGGEPLFVSAPNCPEGYKGGDVEEVLRLIREKGDLILEPAAYASEAKVYNLRYQDGKYYAGTDVVTERYVRRALCNQSRFYVLREHIRMRPTLRTVRGKRTDDLCAVIINRNVFNPEISELYISHTDGSVISLNPKTGVADRNLSIGKWAEVKEQLMEFCRAIPQLEYYAVHFRIAENGVYVLRCDHHPVLRKDVKPSRMTMDFLVAKLAQRRQQERRIFTIARLRNKCWDFFRRKFCAPGYRDFMMREYVTGVVNDFLHFHKTTLKEKLWCYRRGFYSFRLNQYHLTEDNWDKILSDRDYHWLCPINNVYQKWIDDKMTYRQIIEPFAFAAPKYYYHIMNRNGEPYAITMQDCPEKYESTFEGIMELLKDEGSLAIKQSAGEHGDGFFKLSYSDGKYFINHDEASYEEVINKLKGLQRFYNVTEFLSMHDDLCHIYPGSVNTIRVMALNPTGCEPILANAYMRIGTGSTKMTDNIGYGGVFAKVDIETGRYYDAERLNDHVIVPCPDHPDTGVHIEGVLPDWEVAKKALTDICNHFGQLEYLGFDVALTSQGVKILEINKYQDLHRCAFYGDTIQNFFKEKIADKKRILKIK